MSIGRRERLCGYTIGRALIEMGAVIDLASKAGESLRAGDETRARSLVDEIRKVCAPTIDALLNNVDAVCPGVDEEALKRVRAGFAEAKKILARETVLPADLDELVALVRRLKRDLLGTLVER
ncbi:MAG: hypothetical protein QXM08_00530 [Thermofilaceae archaeon]